MPTPQLSQPTISSDTPRRYSSFLENTSQALQQIDGTMAPAGAPTELITSKRSLNEDNTPARNTNSPISVDDVDDSRTSLQHNPLSSPEPTTASPLDSSTHSPITPTHHPDYRLFAPLPETRHRPNSSSTYLKPGARFSGIQRSEKQQYEVVVDIQHIDMSSSFLCGYLRIHALTDEHPTLTTYFEGELIGSKHSFITAHPEWGASELVDFQHWHRFPAWRSIQKEAKRAGGWWRDGRGGMRSRDGGNQGWEGMAGWQNKENVWMRWKEFFLVPDHTVRDLTGASFDGFYYICFNQVTGSITGMYYHLRCEKGQRLDLKPVEEGGYDLGFEFR